MGLDLKLLAIDEGITGYRDDSLEVVKQNQKMYSLPLLVLSYKDLFGWSMDDIVNAAGRKNNCTFCGVFRRQALDRGSVLLGANKLCTGHNADDCAETILMNLQRGDTARLGRTTDLMTGRNESSLPRCKPLTYVYEKEVVLYAHFNRIPFFSTECSYAPGAYRGTTRSLVKDLESVDPRTILGIIHSGAHLVPVMEAGRRTLGKCSRCGYMTSGEVCKACILLEGLRQGRGQESARKGLLSKAS